MLREITLFSDDGPVGQGGSGSHYMTADDGPRTRWIMKSTYFGVQAHRYLYLNEALVGLIGRELGTPIPEPAILRLEEEQARAFKANPLAQDLTIFATERIEPSEPLSQPSADGADPRHAASIIVLDALVWNTDRSGKPEHVLAQRLNGDWQLWAVDHGHCLCVRDALLDDDLRPDRLAQQPYDLLHGVADPEDVALLIRQAQGFSYEDFRALIRMLPDEWIVEPDAPERLSAALVARANALEQVLPFRL